MNEKPDRDRRQGDEHAEPEDREEVADEGVDGFHASMVSGARAEVKPLGKIVDKLWITFFHKILR